MRRLQTLGVALLAAMAFLDPTGSIRGAEYPPATRLKDQVPVAERPDPQTRYGATLVRNITRGYEAIYFSDRPAEGEKLTSWIVYDTAQKKLTCVGLDASHLGRDAAGLRRSAVDSDRWGGIDRWRRHFEQSGREDLLAIGHLEHGFGCSARPGPSAGKPAEIFLERAPGQDPVRLCELEPYDGRALHTICWLRIMPSGDVAVLTGDARGTVLQIYENPLLNAFCAQWNALIEHAYQGQPTVRARWLGSLYDLSEYADRGFDPYLVASDGRVYFGTMPHHSSQSGPVFCFDPKANELILLGDIAGMAGTDRPGAAPHMMHSSLFEINAKVYLTGQDAHYANWDFPAQKEQDRAHYLGSPIVEYDLKTGQSRGLGIPLPGDHALFRITGDPKRNVLYVRRGYSRRHYGPLLWYRLSLDEAGNLLGKPEKLPFREHPAEILIGPQGSVFGIVPDLELEETLQQARKARRSIDKITPTCHLYRCDPELRRAERIATITGTWDVRWAPWQNGKPSAVGIGDDRLYRLDLETGAIRPTVNRPDLGALELGAFVLHGGKMYLMPRVQAKGRVAGRTTALYSIDLDTGKTLYYGLVVDGQGRRPKDLNRFTFLPDGRIFTTGTVYALPTDRHYMPRYRDSEPYRLDCGAFLIDRLPPGRTVPTEP